MMIGAILTQNTSWTRVEAALARLGRQNFSPEAILAMPREELEEAIRTSGYHRQKAGYLQNLAEWVVQSGGFSKLAQMEDEALRSALLKQKGVGYETAYSILLYAFNRPYFVIVAYTRRMLGRMGYPIPEGYEEFRLWFESRIPRNADLYNDFHAQIVIHSKTLCTAKPQCENCFLAENCQNCHKKSVADE